MPSAFNDGASPISALIGGRFILSGANPGPANARGSPIKSVRTTEHGGYVYGSLPLSAIARASAVPAPSSENYHEVSAL
jgi:hypothetical protein